MKIIVNGRFLLHQITGVERYAREIIAELDKMVVPGVVQLAIPPEVENIPLYDNIGVIKIGKFHNHAWEHISLPLYAKREKGILLNLCNVAPLLSPGVVCIHDMKIKTTPQYFNKIFLLWYRLIFFNAIKRSSMIITVSEFSKKEICKYYHIKEEKIHVVPNAWQHYERINIDENVLAFFNLEKGKYYFSLSSLEPNKNFKWVAETARHNSNQIFVIAGLANKTIFAENSEFNYPKNIKFLGYVSDEKAKALMKYCKAFLFPTFYEGFGIPPLEAISAGTKHIIVSDTEVMHEIYKDLAIYIDPYCPCTNLDDLFVNESIAAKQEVLKRYSWKKSANLLWKLLNVYEIEM